MRFGGKVRAVITTTSSLALLSACGGKAEEPKIAAQASSTVEEKSSQPAPVMPPAPLTIGSKDAQDDLYCSGLIYAVHKANAHDSQSQAADKRRADVIALAQAGIAKLKAEGAATDTTTALIADAHAAQASKDLDTASLRIPYETCVARADALPKATP